MLKQKFRMHHMMSITNKVIDNNFHNPNIIQWLFDEDEESQLEMVKTEKQVIK